MAAPGSVEWLERSVALGGELPPVPGSTARLQLHVTSMPEKAKDLWFTWTFEDGRIAGAMASATEADADVTVTLGYADFLSMAQGALDLNAAFMQGRAKATGSTVALLELVPVTSGRPFKALLASL